MKPILLFDLSEVVVNGLKGSEFKLSQTLNDTPDSINMAMHKGSLIEFFLGAITEDQYLADALGRNKYQSVGKEVKKVIRSNFTEVSGMLNLLSELSASGFEMYLMSNHGREWADSIENEFKLNNLFTKLYWSFELGMVKPSEEIFKYFLKDRSLNPGNVIFIDDSVENVDVAIKLGINGIVFESKRQLEQFLPFSAS